MSMIRQSTVCLGLAVWLSGASAWAAEVQVAVAANFAGPLKTLAEAFQKKTGHSVVASSGATGKLYAQVKNGAPFEVLLSADDKTPTTLETEGLALAGTRFTYAIGKLVLFSSKPDFVDGAGAVLKAGKFSHLAIANPKTAPYGAAAIAALTQLKLLDALRPRFVEGENIAQTLQFVESGNAELGFVAWSQVLDKGKPRAGSYWLVPESLYPEIRQDAVALKTGEKNPAVAAFLGFLKSDAARKIIAESGYALPKLAAKSVSAAVPAPATK